MCLILTFIFRALECYHLPSYVVFKLMKGKTDYENVEPRLNWIENSHLLCFDNSTLTADSLAWSNPNQPNCRLPRYIVILPFTKLNSCSLPYDFKWVNILLLRKPNVVPQSHNYKILYTFFVHWTKLNWVTHDHFI